MKISVLLFATYRDFAGTDALVIELPHGANALDAVTQLRVQAPRIPERPVVAINQEYSSLEDVLRDGDELALLPPVAGG